MSDSESRIYDPLENADELSESSQSDSNQGGEARWFDERRIPVWTLWRRRTRRPRGNGTYLVLLWNWLVFSYESLGLGVILNQLPHFQDSHPWVQVVLTIVFYTAIPRLLYPLTGWIADVLCGRYKVILFGLWSMWSLSVFLLVVHLLNYYSLFLTSAAPYELKVFIKLGYALVYGVSMVSLACFQANIIPFGMDQMPDAPGDSYSSFIHWYYWTRNSSVGLTAFAILSAVKSCVGGDVDTEKYAFVDLVLLLFQVFLISIALLLNMAFSKSLAKEPKHQNPLWSIFRITWYVIKHRKPVGYRRTATYGTSELQPPTRFEFATDTYGGPFSSEDVQDVKIFYSILLFLFTSSVAIIMQIIIWNSISGLLIGHSKYKSHSTFLVCSDSDSSMYEVVIWLSYISTFFFSVPFYEFILFPLIRNYVPTMMKRIGVGMFVLVLALLYLVLMDGLSHHFTTHSTVRCLFYAVDNASAKVDLSPELLILPAILLGVGEMLTLIPTLEFISAQSPYSMKGFLIGLYYFVYGTSSIFVAVFITAFAEGFKSWEKVPVTTNSNSCGEYFYSTSLFIGIVGTIVYIVFASFYRKRRRREIEPSLNDHTHLKSYYEDSQRRSSIESHNICC